MLKRKWKIISSLLVFALFFTVFASANVSAATTNSKTLNLPKVGQTLTVNLKYSGSVSGSSVLKDQYLVLERSGWANQGLKTVITDTKTKKVILDTDFTWIFTKKVKLENGKTYTIKMTPKGSSVTKVKLSTESKAWSIWN